MYYDSHDVSILNSDVHEMRLNNNKISAFSGLLCVYNEITLIFNLYH